MRVLNFALLALACESSPDDVTFYAQRLKKLNLTRLDTVAPRSRTGTKSFAEALAILLDSPVHDAGMQTLGGPAYQRKAWAEVMRLAPEARSHAENKKIEALLAELMEGYCATVDVPSNLLTPELLRTFPDAIVIATTRDAAGWLRSAQRMESMVQPWQYHLAVYWIPVVGQFRSYMRALRRMLVWRFGHWKLEITDLGHHEEYIRDVVPKDRLFWFECRDGWEPLCKILRVAVPDRPFPHNNKPEIGAQVFRSLMILGLSLWACVIGLGITAIWLLTSEGFSSQRMLLWGKARHLVYAD